MYTDRRKKEKMYKMAFIISFVIIGVMYFYWESSSTLKSGIYPLKETGVYFVEKVDDNGTFEIKIPILYVRKNPFQFSTPTFSNIELYNSENELISEYSSEYSSVVYSKSFLSKEAHGEINLTINSKTYLDEKSGKLVKEEYFRKQFDHILKTLIFDFEKQRYYYKLGESYNIKAFSKNDDFYNGPELYNVSYNEKNGDEYGYIVVDMSGVKNYIIKKSFLWFQDEDEKLLENPISYIKGEKFDASQIEGLKTLELPYLSDVDNLTLVYKIDKKTREYLQDKVAIINPYYLIEDTYGNREYIGGQSIVVSKSEISDAAIESYKVEKIKTEEEK